MYSFSQNNNCSLYYSRAKSIPFQLSLPHLQPKNPPCTTSTQKSASNFTFNKNYYISSNKPNYFDSAHGCSCKKYRYRSSSLPSQSLLIDLNTLKTPNFSYFQQLRKRQYIKGLNNYRSFSNLRNNYQKNYPKSSFQGQNDRLVSYNDNAKFSKKHNLQTQSASNIQPNLHRFSKNGIDLNIPTKSCSGNYYHKMKTNADRLIKTQTEIKNQGLASNNKPQGCKQGEKTKDILNNIIITHQQKIKTKQNILNRPNFQNVSCSIEVKSDSEGRFYSSIKNNCPDAIAIQNSYLSNQKGVFTIKTVVQSNYLVNHYNSNSKSNIKQNINQKLQTKQKLGTKNQHLNPNEQIYDTHVVHSNRKKSRSNKVNQKQSPQHLKLNQSQQSLKLKAEKQTIVDYYTQNQNKVQSNRIISQYQIISPKKAMSPKNIKSPKQAKSSYNDHKSTHKKMATNLSSKYSYSRHFLNQKQKNRQNNSIRNYQKTKRLCQQIDNKQQKRLVSGQKKGESASKTKQSVNVQSPKRNQKNKRQQNPNLKSYKNYESEHLLKTKK